MGAFGLTLGVLLLGLLLNTLLYGLVAYQFALYYTTEFGDPLWIRAIVALLLLIDTAHSAVAVYIGYHACVTNFGNPDILLRVDWPYPFCSAATAVAAIITQFYLGHRVYLLTRNKLLCTIIGACSVAGCVFAIIASVLGGIIGVTTGLGRLQAVVSLWLGFQTGADILITISLITVLFRARTGVGRTDFILFRLLRGAIQSGLFVSLVAIANLLCFTLWRNTLLYLMFLFPVGRIYTNALLDTLNSRKALLRMTTYQREQHVTLTAVRSQYGGGKVQKILHQAFSDEGCSEAPTT